MQFGYIQSASMEPAFCAHSTCILSRSYTSVHSPSLRVALGRSYMYKVTKPICRCVQSVDVPVPPKPTSSNPCMYCCKNLRACLSAGVAGLASICFRTFLQVLSAYMTCIFAVVVMTDLRSCPAAADMLTRAYFGCCIICLWAT